MNSERLRGAGVYALRYAVKIGLFFAGVFVLALFLYLRVSNHIPDMGTAGLVTLMPVVARYSLPFFPTIALAFVAGYHPEGSAGRMVWRLAINVYLSVLILFFASDPEYLVEGLTLSDEWMVHVDSLSLMLGAGAVSAVMMCAPVCSSVDAVLEYASHRADEGG